MLGQGRGRGLGLMMMMMMIVMAVGAGAGVGAAPSRGWYRCLSSGEENGRFRISEGISL